MKLVRSITLSVSLVGLSALGVIACSGSVEQQPQTSASALTKAPVGTNTHGLVKAVGDALGEVSLRPDQRVEIEKLVADAEARHAPLAARKKEVMTTFADQVEKGSVDLTALQPVIDRGVADFEKVQGDDRSALVKLHDLLDRDQRNAFVDAFEAQLKAKHGEKLGGFMKMKQLADDLKLTDDQRTQIHGLVRDAAKDAWKSHQSAGVPLEGKTHGPPHAWGAPHGRQVLDAFREDQLDIEKVAPPRDMKKMASFGTERMAAVAEKVLPILTPEQRKLAADKLRAHAEGTDGSFGP